MDSNDPTPRTDLAAIPSAAPAPRAPRGVGITHEARRRIGRNLRLLYAEVLDQPLPDRFAALLADLADRTDRTDRVERDSPRRSA